MTEKKNQETKENKEEKKELTPEEQIEKLKAEVEDWKNKYYMAYADTQNLQKSMEKDHQTFIKYRSMGFVEKLLPALDCFASVMKTEPEDQVLKNYLMGFRYIYNMLQSALDSEGVTEVEPKVGDKFDVNVMEAVETIESDKDDLVAEVRRKGYKLHDRMVQHAQVVVTKKPAPKAEEKNEEESEKKDA